MLLAAACFGTTTIVTQRALNDGAALPVFLAWRYALGVVLLSIVAGGARGVRSVGSAWWRLMLIGGGAQAMITALSLSALLYVPPATVAFLFYTYPTWVTVRAMLDGSEPVDRVRVLALLLSLAGIAAIVGNPLSASLDWRGAVLALLAAAVYAVLIPWLAQVQAGVRAEPAAAWISLGACVVFVATSVSMGHVLWPLSRPVMALAAFAAVIPTTVAFVAFMRGVVALGPVRTSIVSTVEPFWTALLAAIALRQAAGPRVWVGGVLICTSVVLVHAQARQKSRTDELA